jgi:hypothetical protein
LNEVVELCGDKELALRIFSLEKDFLKYNIFRKAMSLGVTYSVKDLSFSEMIIFCEFKEKMNGR